MKSLLPLAFVVLSSVAYAQATEGGYSRHFSPEFRRGVDEALAQWDPDARIPQLVRAMARGTDEEVFFVLPLLFPSEARKEAKQAEVCQVEWDASTGHRQAWLDTAKSEREGFVRSSAGKVRSDMHRLISCMDWYFKGEQPRRPDTHLGRASPDAATIAIEALATNHTHPLPLEFSYPNCLRI